MHYVCYELEKNNIKRLQLHEYGITHSEFNLPISKFMSLHLKIDFFTNGSFFLHFFVTKPKNVMKFPNNVVR